MKLEVFIVLSVAALAVSKPSRQLKDEHITGKLARMLRNQRTPGANCADFSAAFGAMLQHGDDPQGMVIYLDSIKESLTEAQIEALRERMYGFDITNYDRMRELYTCDITDVSSLSQLKAKVDAHEFVYNNLRLVYDFLVLSLPRKFTLEADSLYDLINTMEYTGLLGLDSAGVESLGVLLYGENYENIKAGYIPQALFSASNEEKCDHLIKAVAAVLNEYNQEALDYVDVIGNFTGFNLVSREDSHNLICDIVDGSADGLKGVYAVVEGEGVFRQLYKSVYPLLVQLIPELLKQTEETLEYLKDPNERHSIFGGLPNDEVETSMNTIRLGIEFLREFENSGLLSLIDDM